MYMNTSSMFVLWSPYIIGQTIYIFCDYSNILTLDAIL